MVELHSVHVPVAWRGSICSPRNGAQRAFTIPVSVAFATKMRFGWVVASAALRGLGARSSGEAVLWCDVWAFFTSVLS